MINSKRPIGEVYSVLRASRPVWSPQLIASSILLDLLPENSLLLGAKEESQKATIIVL